MDVILGVHEACFQINEELSPFVLKNVSALFDSTANQTQADILEVTADDGELLNTESKYNLDSSVHLGLATGLIITFLKLHAQPSKVVWNYKYFHLIEEVLSYVVFYTLNILVSLMLVPIFGTIFITLKLYRTFVEFLLHAIYKERFVCLMDGMDTVWALEKDTSKSIVNLLAIFEVTGLEENFRDHVRKIIASRLSAHDKTLGKLMFCRRKSVLGYFYWERKEEFLISNYINWMTTCTSINHINDNDIYLSDMVSSLVNKPLPYDNSASWEILVGCFPLSTEVNENGKVYKYPVLFRVHHSVGDGLALLNVLANILADKIEDTKEVKQSNCSEFSENCFKTKEGKKIPSIHSLNEVKFYPCKIKSDVGKYNSTTLTGNYNGSTKEKIQKKFSYKELLAQDIKNDSLEEENPVKIAVQDDKFPKYHKCNTINILNRPKLIKQKFIHFETELNMQTHSEIQILNECNTAEITMPAKVTDKKRLEKISLIILALYQKIKKEVFDKENWITIFNKCSEVRNYIKQFAIISEIPTFIFREVIMNSRDINPIHKLDLSGKKVVGWYVDQAINENNSLVDMIKYIKSKLPNQVHFTDVFLAALSASLDIYFRRRNSQEIPSNLTVVLPARMKPVSKYTTNCENFVHIEADKNINKYLNNNFSVGVLKLPICPSESCDKETCPYYSPEERLRKVCEECTSVRQSPQYYIYYWLMGVTAAVIPYQLLSKLLLDNIHTTLVVSNMRGPSEQLSLTGHKMASMWFWVPNRGTTGVGVTLMSYAGRLHLGIMADQVAIDNNQDAKRILQQTVDEIKHLYYSKLESTDI